MATKLRPKLLCLYQLQSNVIDIFKEGFDVELPDSAVASYDFAVKHAVGKNAILCIPQNRIDKAVLDAAGPTLKTVVTSSAGYEHVDLEECKKRNISVGYLGSVVSEGMAEFAIGLMIATARLFKDSIREVVSGDWASKWAPAKRALGREIRDSTVGIVGLGFIGQNIVKLLQSFQTKQILYYGPREKPEAKHLGAEYVSLNDLLKNSDFVIASCSSNSQTREMFNANAFQLMKPTSVFINIARGDLVNHEDLYKALVSKQIFAAGLDITTPEPFPHDHPLAQLENCLILPHIGTASLPTRLKMFQKSYENLIAGINGQPMPIQLV